MQDGPGVYVEAVGLFKRAPESVIATVNIAPRELISMEVLLRARVRSLARVQEFVDSVFPVQLLWQRGARDQFSPAEESQNGSIETHQFSDLEGHSDELAEAQKAVYFKSEVGALGATCTAHEIRHYGHDAEAVISCGAKQESGIFAAGPVAAAAGTYRASE